MGIDESSFPGIFDIEVTFLEGPKSGDVENHQLWFLPGGRILVLQPPFPGAGRWSITGDTLSFIVHNVILDDHGEPANIVRITYPDGRLDPHGDAFEGKGTSKIYGPGALTATQHFEQRGRRQSLPEK